MAARDALDLFGFLGELNAGNTKAYAELTDEAKKAAHPLVIMRWMSGTSDAQQVMRLNTFVNPYVFSMGEDKELLFQLLGVAGTGYKRNNWIKGPGQQKASKLLLETVAQAYECTNRDAGHLLELMDEEDVLRCAEELGLDKDQVTKLKADFKKGKDEARGTTPGRKPPSSKRK
jgi:hypothetical protein